MKSIIAVKQDQESEIMLASIVTGVSASELSLIPTITGDSLDHEELEMIYNDFISYAKKRDYSQQKETSLISWLLETQFEGLSTEAGVKERSRLISLGIL